jgi:hypothetical protein
VQRRVAITAFVVAALLLLLALRADEPEPGAASAAGRGSGGGLGTGTGSGIGPGAGTGAGDAGTGPGSGTAGIGRGSIGPDDAAPPEGRVDGTALAEADPAAPAPAAQEGTQDQEEEERPEYGFTRRGAAPSADPVGVPEGRPTSGASGLRGGGGGSTEQQIVEVVQTFPNSRLVVNLDATSSMGGSRDAVARVFPEILENMQGGTIAVHVFRDVLDGEENEVVVRPTPKTRNRKAIQALIDRVMAVPPEGGGDLPETGYQLVIANMRKYPPGKPDRPNVEFIVTDAEEKQPQLLGELRKLAERTHTLVFVIDVSRRPPLRTQLAPEPAPGPPAAPE